MVSVDASHAPRKREHLSRRTAKTGARRDRPHPTPCGLSWEALSFPYRFREVSLAKNASHLRRTSRYGRIWEKRRVIPLNRPHAVNGSIKDGPSSRGDETHGDTG